MESFYQVIVAMALWGDQVERPESLKHHLLGRFGSPRTLHLG